MREQRLENRFDRRVPLRLRLEDRHSLSGVTSNLSNRGLSCRVPCRVPPFSRLTVSMDLSFPRRGLVTLPMDALVVRAERCHADDRDDEHDLGLFFLNLDQQKATIINEFLNAPEEGEHAPTAAPAHKRCRRQGIWCSLRDDPRRFLEDCRLTPLDPPAGFGELSSVLAHEIKNPLACLAGSLQVLAEESRGLVPADDLFSELFGQIERIDNLVDLLLQFSTTEAPRLELIRVENLINGALGLLGAKLKKKNIEVALCHGLEQPLIAADERLLRQAFLNVFSNVIDGMEDGGYFSVTTCWADKTPLCERAACACFVQEQHLGLSVVVMNSYPSRQRSVPPAPAQSKRRGLNLSLTQKIIEQHHGSIFVQGRAEEGSVLLIGLPLPARSATGA